MDLFSSKNQSTHSYESINVPSQSSNVTVVTWQSRTLALLAKAYASIPPEKAAEYLGLPTDQIIRGILIRVGELIVALQEQRWAYDAAKNLLIPAKIETRTIIAVSN